MQPFCVAVHRNIFDTQDSKPIKIEYGSKVLGRAAKRRVNFRPPDELGAKTSGSSAPLGKRNIASIEEQFESLKKGTMD